MTEYTRFFLISYVTSSSTGNVKIAQDKFPSEYWLKTVAIPELWEKMKLTYMPNAASIVITGFYEFTSAQDFYDFIDGHDMDQQIKNLLL